MKDKLMLLIKAILATIVIFSITMFIIPLFIVPFFHGDTTTLVLYAGLIFTIILCALYVKKI